MTDVTTMADAAADWVAALSEMPAVDRDREVTVPTSGGGNYSYKYATLTNVIETIREPLKEHGFAFAQSVEAESGQVAVTTIFYHTSGMEYRFGPLRLPAGNTAQAAGSAITYARRYALTAALGLATEDDDDGARAPLSREEPEQISPATWLATRVQMFKEWDDDRRKEQYTAAMEALEIERFKTQEHAEQVFEWMSDAYYTEFPSDDTAPF